MSFYCCDKHCDSIEPINFADLPVFDQLLVTEITSVGEYKKFVKNIAFKAYMARELCCKKLSEPDQMYNLDLEFVKELINKNLDELINHIGFDAEEALCDDDYSYHLREWSDFGDDYSAIVIKTRKLTQVINELDICFIIKTAMAKFLSQHNFI